jgi:hypothetical protein
VLVRCAAILTLLASAATAHAEAVIVGGRSARMIGRAGVGTASDDGAAALLINPAGLARRDGTRVQLGLAFVDDEMFWIDNASSPATRDQSSSRLLPLVAIEGGIGDFVVGAGVMTTAHSKRIFRAPIPLGIPPDSFGRSFQYRYAGLEGGFRRDTLVAGVARRLGDTVAVGVSFGASRASVVEGRRLWAGDVARDGLELAAPSPAYDCELALDGTDSFVPSVTAGVLVAPADSRVELAASAAWSAPIAASGNVDGVGTSPVTAVVLDGPTARIEIEQPLAVRSGVRWLGEHVIVEAGVDLFRVRRSAQHTEWQLDGVTIYDTTLLGASRAAALSSLPSRLSTRTHGVLRGALDVELIGGFLWATGGYAYATAGTSGVRQSPTFGDLGGHTLGLGLEANAGAFTVTLGWARTWSLRSPEPVTSWRLDNPFATGDGPIPNGTFDGSTDMLGLSIDVELAEPE